MPQSWSNKDERQYEHIKDSEKKQGRSTKRSRDQRALDSKSTWGRIQNLP